MPRQDQYLTCIQLAAPRQDDVLVFGGINSNTAGELYCYNVVKDAWTLEANLGHTFLPAVCADPTTGVVYVFDFTRSYTYWPDSRTWGDNIRGFMLYPRHRAMAVYLPRLSGFLIVGGFDPNGIYLDVMEFYSTVTRDFHEVPHLRLPQESTDGGSHNLGHLHVLSHDTLSWVPHMHTNRFVMHQLDISSCTHHTHLALLSWTVTPLAAPSFVGRVLDSFAVVL